MNTSSYGVEKGTLIRVPATANLMVDSANRPLQFDASGLQINSCWDFSINKKQSLIQGFFSRIGTTEVVLEWCFPNVNSVFGNTEFRWADSSGNIWEIPLGSGTYTAAEALDAIAGKMNLPVYGGGAGTGYTFDITQDALYPGAELANTNVSGRKFKILSSVIARQLDLIDFVDDGDSWLSTTWTAECPDIRPYRYIDFVCDQLTSVQDVKDSSTNDQTRDVLCRFYFANDGSDQLDAYGYPILMGYTKFCLRRIFNPPKQIKWEQNIPVGGYLRFTVVDEQGDIIPFLDDDGIPLSTSSNWLMTLQLSEG